MKKVGVKPKSLVLLNLKSTFVKNQLFMKSKSYFLWAVIGAAAALTAFTLPMAKPNPVRHVVVFKFKPATTAQQVEEVTNAIRSLKDKIPGILSFEHGVNNSPEKKDLGFNHVYLLTFKDAASRDTYLPHPEHVKFGELLGKLSVLEDVFVVDFEPSK
jgi:Stress responsive A/B Barrel Domain